MPRIACLIILVSLFLFSKNSFCQETTLGIGRLFPYPIAFKANDSELSKQEQEDFEPALQIILKVKSLQEEKYMITLQAWGCQEKLTNIPLYLDRCKAIIQYINSRSEEITPMIIIKLEYLISGPKCDEPYEIFVHGARI